MICIYCGSGTRVTNSRKHKRQPSTWRRRQCTRCRLIFTTREYADLTESLRFARPSGTLEPFLRDKLFISLYDSCKHRKTALEDATALTDTIIQRLLRQSSADTGVITRLQVIQAVSRTLGQFDAAALAYFTAYHKL